jgi:hypothetical protein
VLIAVIGAHWLTSTDGQGGRRLDNPEDFVRMEIATALRRDIRVIPVLVDGALMPQSTDLPNDLKQLVRRNALQVGETHFDDDCRRLVAAIEEVFEKTAAERREHGEKERLEHEPKAQPLSPLVPQPPSIPPRKRKPHSVLRVVTLLVLAIGVVVFATMHFRFHAWKPTTSVAAVTPSPLVTDTATVEGKAPSTPEVAVQPSVKPTAPVTVAITSAISLNFV